MALSKEFYLDEIRSKYPNSYNESLKDLPVKDLEDMLDFLDQALEKADGGSIGIEVLFKPKREKFNMGGGQFTSGGNISPGTDRRGNVRNDNPFTGGGGGGNTIKVAELTPKQKKFIDKQKFGLQENLIPARDIFNKITNPKLGIFDTPTFGFGGQEPTTEEEFNEYLRSIGVVQQVKDGGRVGMVSGGALKGIMNLFKRGGDDAVDLAKQEEIFRTGPITTKFLEDVDDKVITKFVRTRDTKGPGSYGMYDNFDDMPAGLKAAEIIKRFVDRKTGKINYEDAEFFIGRKLKGDETIDELIDIAIKEPIGTGSSPFKDFEEYVLKGEKKADGGRVGLFMGGPALEGQALDIYNSMNAYGFSDQEIADALAARGLYTPGGSTPNTPDQGIINQQLQTGGGRDDNQTGFGKFGNLDPTTEKTFVKDVYTIDKNMYPGAPMTGSFKPTKVTGYKNVNTGAYQTLEGKNINHAGINIKPGIVALMEAIGLGEPKNLTGLPYKEGYIAGTFTGKKLSDFNPLNLFKKQQATVAEINAMNQKAIKDMQEKQRAEEAAKRAATERAIISGGANIGGGGGGGNITTRAGTFAPGDYSDVAGTLADPREKMDFYKDGGLATMFTRRR